MITNILIIFLLIVLNGVFAGAEMALMTAKRPRLQTMAEEGNQQANRVIKVQDEPGRYLAAIQVGITLIGSLASAVGGAEIVRQITPALETLPLVGEYANEIGLTAVVLTITFFTLIIGELVPKQIALNNAESLALAVIRPIRWLAWIATIPIKVLDFTTNLTLRLLGQHEQEKEVTSEAEIEMMVQQAVEEGGIEPEEEKLIRRVFDYSERRVWDVVTPRPDIIALAVESTPLQAMKLAKKSGLSRLPIHEGSVDRIVGYVHVKDLLLTENADSGDLRPFLNDIPFIPNSLELPAAFAALTKSGKHIAIALDEYGGTDGLLTVEDLLEVIVGDIEDEHDQFVEGSEQIEEGVWLFEGTAPLLDVAEMLDFDAESNGLYATLAGFVLDQFGRLPQVGDFVESDGYRFQIEKMDDRRIEQIRIQRYEQ